MNNNFDLKNIIRFFRSDNRCYILYTNNETVNNDLIKCYASKLIKDNNSYIGSALDDDDLKHFEQILIEILKSNHNQQQIPVEIQDFEINECINIDIRNYTEVNYVQGLINSLSKNKRNVDYYELYIKEREKNINLRHQTDLQNKEIDELENDIKYYVDTVMKQQGC